ncbi:MAG: S-methyl-5'-thioadenosine phosphorylase, partial [Planctomycetota bacterium]
TDFDAWKPHDPEQSRESLLQEIIGNLQKATAANLALMKAALADVAMLRDKPSPAHDALALGIWSDKSRIDPAEVERLAPLWGRHFGAA